MDVCLGQYGQCNFISAKHALIFYDEVSRLIFGTFLKNDSKCRIVQTRTGRTRIHCYESECLNNIYDFTVVNYLMFFFLKMLLQMNFKLFTCTSNTNPIKYSPCFSDE